MKTARTIAAGAATAIILAGMAAPAMAKPGNNGNPNNSKKIAAAVTVDGVMDHLGALQAIADANDGNRAAGSSGYEASGDYVEATLQAAGYQTERQYFTFERETVVAETLRQNSPTKRSIDAIVMAYSPNTPEGGVTADLVAPSGSNLGCTADNWAGVDLSGKIAIISRGSCSFGIKAAIAAEKGAAAVIIYNNTAGALNGTLGELGDSPTAGINRTDGQALVKDMANGPVNVTLDLRVRVDAVKTFNILAETAKGRTDNVVMVGAHLDSVEDGPGINDNGSGTAAILETAVQLAKVNKLNNQVRFAWWAAEEYGLLGSTHYVDDLVANDAAELDDIATYLNFDMVASPNYIIGVYDADESTYKAPVAVPDGSIETEQVFTDWFDSIGQPWVDTAFSGRSDYQAFISNGIPASGLFTGADGSKTAEEVAMFGGTPGIMYDPNYHAPGDNLSNVNAEALDIMSDAIAVATLSLAQDTSKINGERSAGKSGKPHPKGPIVRSEEAAA